jgi:hypothetical protein
LCPGEMVTRWVLGNAVEEPVLAPVEYRPTTAQRCAGPWVPEPSAWHVMHGEGSASRGGRKRRGPVVRTGPRTTADFWPRHCTALIMPKIGRYIATIMPPTITPSTTIMIGSMRERSAPTAASTSSS